MGDTCSWERILGTGKSGDDTEAEQRVCSKDQSSGSWERRGEEMVGTKEKHSNLKNWGWGGVGWKAWTRLRVLSVDSQTFCRSIGLSERPALG